MSRYLRTYDPEKVAVIINGVEVTGFADDTMITAERSEDLVLPYVGVKGDVSRAINQNHTGTITIRLQQTSKSLDMMYGYAVADGTGYIAPVVNILIRDPSSGAEILGTQGWLQALPTMEFGKEITEQEFVFFCVNLNFSTEAALTIGSTVQGLI